ncbi:MAG: AMP-dependent synthetase/ligase [Bacteroidota bacterium]
MRTLNYLFENSVAKFSDNVLLYEKTNSEYSQFTYKEIQLRVHAFSAGLMQLGLEMGDRVSLLAEGSNNWIISELAILMAGGINVPLSVKLSDSDEIKFRVDHSGSRYFIVSKNQRPKVEHLLKEIPQLEKLIVYGDENDLPDNVLSFAQVERMGAEFLKQYPEKFAQRWKSVEESDYATISYTSGTTSDPKGVILTHRNYTANVEQSLSLFEVPSYFTTLLILPWDHAFAHTVGIYPLMKGGGSIASVKVGTNALETLKNIPVNIKEIKPHFILSVPALAKNFKKNIEKGVSDKGAVARTLFSAGLKVAYAYNGNGANTGKGFRALLKPLYAFFDKILFSKIRENFGGRLRFFVGGGALLDIEIQRFFFAIGIPMYQGYGLSEAAPVISSNNVDRHKMGSSGVICDNLEITIRDDDGNVLPTGVKGEIVIRGENVMAGYWRNEVSTKETIKDGWLYTGDLGYMSADGFLYVLGRFKSLLISDDGEKFSPEGIEEALIEQSPLIEQCMLYNNQNAYTVGLVVVNKEAVKKALAQINVDGMPTEEVALKLIDDEIGKFRPGGKYGHMFPNRWLPTGVAVLDEAFTEDNKLVNSTLKIVRPKITERYKERIEFMYTPEGKQLINNQNKDSMRSILN